MSRTGSRAHLRAITPDATPEEAAAIVAAIMAADERRRAAAAAAAPPEDPSRLDHWRASPRLVARRSGMARGPWRLSGRLPRRSRA